MENKKVVILAGILFCFAIVVSSVSATNYYNYDKINANKEIFQENEKVYKLNQELVKKYSIK